LVAGVSPEINTPIGISVTAPSHLVELMDELKIKFAQNKAKKSDLTTFLPKQRQLQSYF
jgi:hypothetical protein